MYIVNSDNVNGSVCSLLAIVKTIKYENTKATTKARRTKKIRTIRQQRAKT
jgi:hypothetical protein